MKVNAESEIKNLVCVEFPGKVVNADRAIECLGGLNKISKASNDQSKLECRFRPDILLSRPVFGDRINSTSFMLKVITKKKKSATGETERVVVGASIYGKVKHVFKFSNLNDFQYLPMEKSDSGEYKSLYQNLFPLPQLPLTWESDTVPFCFPPVTFSRTDSITPYLATKVTGENSTALIGRTRDRRSNYVKFVSHEMKDIPTSPNEHTIRYIQLKFVNDEQIRRMKELFNDRPVWTKSALECVTRYPELQLKYLLALNAFHFTSGPFRIAWVRFGYDPRKDPSARKYQVIDYRLRNYVISVMRERLPEKFARRRTRSIKNENCEKLLDPFDESLYKFKPGYIPPQKQVFYQVCDIEIPEIQDKLNNFTDSESYDPKSGWLTERFLEQVRDAIDKQVLATIRYSNEGCDPTDELYIPLENVEVDHDDYAEDMDFDVSDQDDFMDAEDL